MPHRLRRRFSLPFQADRRPIAAQAGLTLVELLVATGVLMILTLAVVTILRGATQMWRSHESASDAHDRARSIMQTVETDLRRAAHQQVLSIPGRPPMTRFLVGQDLWNRNYLCFTTTLGNETAPAASTMVDWDGLDADFEYIWPGMQDPDTRPALGMQEVSYVFSPFPRFKGVRRDSGVAFVGDYLSPEVLSELESAGQMELSGNTAGGVFMLDRTTFVPMAEVDPRTLEFVGHGLYRGYVAPPPIPYDGGNAQRPGSLFYHLDRAAQGRYRDTSETVAGVQASMFDMIRRQHEFLADGVLFIGVQFFNPASGEWVPDFREPITREEVPQFDDRDYPPRSGLVRITVTCESRTGNPTRATLASGWAGANEIRLNGETFGLPAANGPNPFVLLGGATVGRDGLIVDRSLQMQWVRYGQAGSGVVRGIAQGQRLTPPAEEPYLQGSPVRWGITLQKVIRIDGGR